jgi:hypothetical protein
VDEILQISPPYNPEQNYNRTYDDYTFPNDNLKKRNRFDSSRTSNDDIDDGKYDTKRKKKGRKKEQETFCRNQISIAGGSTVTLINGSKFYSKSLFIFLRYILPYESTSTKF